MAQQPGIFSFNAQKQGGGALVPYVLGKQSDLLISQLHGTKYHAAYGGAGVSLFSGATQTAVTTSAGLATTFVGICLSNPAASGYNLSVRRIRGALIVAPSSETAFVLIIGYAAGGITAHTTALAPTPGLIGSGATPVGKLDSACTLVGTPSYYSVVVPTPSATAVAGFSEDLDGSILLPPGAYAAIGTTIAGPANGFLGFMEWVETVQ